MSISPLSELIRRIVISGQIREDTAAQFVEQLTALEYLDPTKGITVYIDTYGGFLHSCMMMFDAIMMCQCKIRTIGVGKVMSAGTLLLAAGNQGDRYITPNTRVMIHEVQSSAYGSLTQMENEIQETRALQDTYIKLLALHTRKTKAEIENALKIKSENYMSAQQAVDFGLCDKVIQQYNKVKPPTKEQKGKSKTKSKKKAG